MAGILIVSHGSLSTSLLDTAVELIGRRSNIRAIELAPDDDIEGVREQMRRAVEYLQDEEGVLILSDLFGGTPSNLGISLMEPGRVDCVAGVNLPMVLRAAAGSGGATLIEFAKELQAIGRRYISVTPRLEEIQHADQPVVALGHLGALTLSLDRCIADLTMLSSLLKALQGQNDPTAGIGHNSIPIIESGTPAAVEDALLAALVVRRELIRPDPQPEVIRLSHRLLGRLLKVLARIGGWAAQKGDKFVDGVIDSVSKAAGTAVIIGVIVGALEGNVSELLPQLEDILTKLLDRLG
jgi:PTS system mannose-specific IIA component